MVPGPSLPAVGNQPPQPGLWPESLGGHVTLDLFKHLLETLWLLCRSSLLLGTVKGDDFICRVTTLSKLPTLQGATLLGSQDTWPFQLGVPSWSSASCECTCFPPSPPRAHTLSTRDEKGTFS